MSITDSRFGTRPPRSAPPSRSIAAKIARSSAAEKSPAWPATVVCNVDENRPRVLRGETGPKAHTAVRDLDGQAPPTSVVSYSKVGSLNPHTY